MTDVTAGTPTGAADSSPNRWLPLMGGVLMNLALGVIYAWSVFVAPFSEDFGWTRTQVSVVFTIAILSVGSWFVVAGFLQDRFGPQKVAAFGGILYALGFFLASQTESLIWLYITFGAIAGAGNGFGYAIPIPVCSKWFPDRRGLAVGLVVGGYGAGSGIYGPVAREVLIPSYGWQGTMQISAAIFLVMTLAAAYLLKNPPAGYRPPTPAAAPAAGGAPKAAAPATAREFTTAEMVRTPTFYLLWIAYCLGAAAGLMVISQLVPVGEAAGLGPRGSRADHRRHRQHRRAGAVGLDVRHLRPAEHVAADGAALGRGAAPVLPSRRAGGALLPAARRDLLLLRHAAVGLRLHLRRLLRHAAHGGELRPAVLGVGRRRHRRGRSSRAASSTRQATTSWRSTWRPRCPSSPSPRSCWPSRRRRRRRLPDRASGRGR